MWFYQKDLKDMSNATLYKDSNGDLIKIGDTVYIDNGTGKRNWKVFVKTICKEVDGIITLEDEAFGHWTRQLWYQPERLKIMKNNLWPEKPLYNKYCIEPHGNQNALYFGRDSQSHGLRLCNVSDFDKDKDKTIKKIETALNQVELIEFFASKEIYIAIVPDGFIQSYGCCWRPIIIFKDKEGKWREEDIGCLMNRNDAFSACIKFCECILKQKDQHLQ